jgi:hypothetical protein
VLSGVLIVFPLWYISTRHKDVYGVSALGIIGLLAAAALGKKVYADMRNAGGMTGYMKRRVVPLLRKTAAALSAALGLYGIVLLFAHKNYTLGIGALFIYIIFFGMLLSINAK